MKRILPCIMLLLAVFAAVANIPNATSRQFPGTHKLEVTAQHPMGLFTTNRVAWFSNKASRVKGYGSEGSMDQL